MEGPPIEVFTKEKELRAVDLDQPDVMQFLERFKQKFGKPITYEGQSLKEIAREIQQVIEGAESS